MRARVLAFQPLRHLLRGPHGEELKGETSVLADSLLEKSKPLAAQLRGGTSINCQSTRRSSTAPTFLNSGNRVCWTTARTAHLA